jgi:hypothetical protein
VTANTPHPDEATLPVVTWYAIPADAFLDAINVCGPRTRARIMERQRVGEIVYHRCNGARGGHVHWRASGKPPLPVAFSGRDPRVCCSATVEALLSE